MNISIKLSIELNLYKYLLNPYCIEAGIFILSSSLFNLI